jgi:hypothetical protein
MQSNMPQMLYCREVLTDVKEHFLFNILMIGHEPQYQHLELIVGPGIGGGLLAFGCASHCGGLNGAVGVGALFGRCGLMLGGLRRASLMQIPCI